MCVDVRLCVAASVCVFARRLCVRVCVRVRLSARARGYVCVSVKLAK